MVVPEVQDNMAPEKFGNLRLYLRRRPVMLGLLTAMAVVFFLAVTGLASVYRAQHESIGDRWFQRGKADLSAHRYAAAITDFRAALLYSRDNYTYQLNLAEALIGMGQRAQANAYLLNLWDREPDDGVVNLELARIAAQRGEIPLSTRYYHDAVYAVWPQDQEPQRRQARLELVDLLLRNNQKAQAQAELIALAENAGGDPAEENRLGDLFLRADGYDHALGLYAQALKVNRRDAAAMAGAGYAAFQLGRYSLAQHYLQNAVTANASDKKSAELLNTTELVLRMDPFRPQLSTAERNRIVIEAFAIAGDRLKNCALPRSTAPPGTGEPDAKEQWTSLKPQITPQRLQRDADLAQKAMAVVFLAERETSALCGIPTGRDLALLLIGKLHEGS
jgi:tetratricopeptide (TPR) repeat protein